MEYYIQNRLGETEIAVLDSHGDMVAYHLERHSNHSLVGAVFVARVIEVNKSQSFLVVDLGNKQSAILNGGKNLTEGQCVLVQVLRDGFQHKMPAVHMRISLENLFFVKNSTGRDITFERSIGQGKARAELNSKIFPIIGEDTGIFIKKNSLYTDAKTLKSAYDDVSAELNAILNEELNHVRCVRPAPTLIQRIICSAPQDSVCIADDLETVHLLNQAQKDLKTHLDIHHYKQGDCFLDGGIHDMVDSLLLRQVPMQNGGSVVIDTTEALTAIDVNMGDVHTMNKGDDALFRFNKSACRTIAQHITLRNISGLIVIDFVRCKNRGMMKQLPKILQSHMRTFDSHGIWDVMDITKSGLLEMTRKRTHPSISDIVLSPLMEREKNTQTIALEMLQQILRTVSVGTPTIFAPEPVLKVLQKSTVLEECEHRIKKSIDLQVHTNAYTDWI